VKKFTDQRGKSTTYTYDERNRLKTIALPQQPVKTYDYDLVGNLEKISWAADGTNRAVRYSYDARNRCIRVVDELDRETSTAYDDSGNIIKITDAKQQQHRYAYDALNRKVRAEYPAVAPETAGEFEEWSYDSNGNVATYRSRAGWTWAFSYDTRNRETRAEWNDGVTEPVVTEYYDNSLVKAQSSGNTRIEWDYFEDGSMRFERVIKPNAVPREITYTPNIDGLRASVQYPDSGKYLYLYSKRNELKNISEVAPDQGIQSLVDYVTNLDPTVDNRIRTLVVPQITTIASPDVLNRIQKLTHTKSGTAGPLDWFEYTYTQNAEKKSVSYSDGKGDAFAYDKASQLTGVLYDAENAAAAPVNPDATAAYNYDATGNRVSATVSTGGVSDATSYSANELNQYRAIGAQTAAYLAGDLVAFDGWSYVYDANHRMIRASKGGVVVEFHYDALNRQTERTVHANGISKTTEFVWDGWNLVEEYEGGVLKYSYLHGAGTDEILFRRDGTGTRLWYLRDGQGSVSSLVTDSGMEVETYRYDVWGNVTIYNASGATVATSAVANRFLYTGREWIEALELYDYRNRSYHPRLGRFLQADPLGFEAGNNFYNYCGNNPATLFDPTGLNSMNVDPGGNAVGSNSNDSIGPRITITGTGDFIGEVSYGDPIVITGSASSSGASTWHEYGASPLASSNWRSALGKIQEAADVMGMLEVPVLSPLADLASGVISLIQGDYVGAITSVFAIVPGVGIFAGAAKIARRVKMAAKTAGQGPVIIGETMARVEAAAAKYPGAKILNDMPDFRSMGMNADQVTSSMMQYNRKWILEQMRSGRQIIDIGADANRVTPSIFYQMEQNMLKNYQKLHPEFSGAVSP
jgi:RHS repeat-associated protein